MTNKASEIQLQLYYYYSSYCLNLRVLSNPRVKLLRSLNFLRRMKLKMLIEIIPTHLGFRNHYILCWLVSLLSYKSCICFHSTTGSLNGFSIGAKRTQGTSHSWSGKQPLGALYDLLIAPMEEFLPNPNSSNPHKDLVLVLQGGTTTTADWLYLLIVLSNSLVQHLFICLLSI